MGPFLHTRMVINFCLGKSLILRNVRVRKFEVTLKGNFFIVRKEIDN